VSIQKTHIAGVVLFAVAGLVAGAAPQQLLPIDEAPRHHDFFSFRAQLQAAIARHDVEAVVGVVNKDIRNSFGGDDGIDGFRRIWKPNEADSTLWAELGAILALGGTFSGDQSFTAPYVFSRWPDRFDGFEHVALVASDVRVREAPRSDAATLTSLSFAILPVVRSNGIVEVDGWTAVQLEGRKTGYVATRLARSPIDYRAMFNKIDGRWQMTFFAAGD
jgi:hypothetical protein